MKWNKQFILIACSTFSLLFGTDSIKNQEEPIVVQSGEVEYNGKEISLTTNVVIQHEWGKVSADRLNLILSDDKEKKMKFSSLKMRQNVKIQATQGGTLSCQEAELDYALSKGIFLGNQEQPDVVYVDQAQKGGDHDSPLFEIKSLQMQMMLERQYESDSQTNKSSIRQIQADGQVRAYYNQEYVILADHAIYERPLSAAPLVPQEVLTLYGSDADQGVCQVTNQHGDHLHARRVTIYLKDRRMVLDQPRGFILTQREGEIQPPLHFSSEQCIWDEKEQRLILLNQVQLNQIGLGQLHTDKEISIYRELLNGKKRVSSIVSPEETVLTYLGEDEIEHHVMCHGSLIVNHAQSRVLMRSPLNGEGVVPDGKQVFFENIAGNVYADQVELTYQRGERSLVPTHLNLVGHVQILNRFDGHLQESGSVLQYAVADEATYFPLIKEMTLSGHNQNRVLVIDKVNNLSMRAPSVKIRRDEKTNKPSFKGIGDVRFTFIESDLKELLYLKEQAP